MIEEQLLISEGATYKTYHKDQIIFEEGTLATHYYQVAKGQVRMVSENELEEKEYIQGIAGVGESFGEPPLFDGLPYPSAAYAASSCKIIKFEKQAFFKLLKKDSAIHLQITTSICQRLRYKSIMLREITCYPAAHRVKTLLQYYKSLAGNSGEGSVQIKHTRKEIALQTGLRIETVIRAVKEMESQNILRIENGKIYI